MNQFNTNKIHQENKEQVVDKLKESLIKDKIIKKSLKAHNDYYKNCAKLEEFEKEFGAEGRAKFDEWLRGK